jgi:hypothetical protein
MHSLPEARGVREFLDRARRRAILLRALRMAAGGLVLSAVVYILFGLHFTPGVAVATAALLIGVAVAAGGIWSVPDRLGVALMIERRTPASRNLILTAAELSEHRTSSTPAIAGRIFDDARRVIGQVALSGVLPAGSTVAIVFVALAIAGAAVVAGPGGAVSSAAPDRTDAAATFRGIVIDVAPPEYSRQAATKLRDPVRVAALAGSRLHVTATADAAGVTLETVTGAVAMKDEGDGRFSADAIADADGYLALVPRRSNGTAGTRLLIGLAVTPDTTPRVRVTAPGKDILVPDGRRTLSIAVEADDDLALATLRLKYTRVSGSGENFSFTEGDVPLTVAQTNERAWTARADWNIGALQLEPGDMLIYRGVATDRRPGAPPAESDAFIVEVAAPGAASGDGFAIDDREDRYALSQQMVIVKTERLLGRRAKMPAEDALSETLDLAAEQRQVRAEFVFMMGGELADAGVDLNSLNEEVEAAGEEDLAAGRLANQGRLDILRAIRSMSRAASRLADGDPVAALPLEKEALNFLQRAFSKSRYILRTLGARERLDLSRRLTGVLAALGRDRRAAVEAPRNPRADALRTILSEVASLTLDGPGDSLVIGSLAQRALQIDPASAPVREAASKLTTLEIAVTERRGPTATRALRNEAAVLLAALVRRELPAGSAPSVPAELTGLAGALADSLRAGARKP